jgi:hypothetical protein
VQQAGTARNDHARAEGRSACHVLEIAFADAFGMIDEQPGKNTHDATSWQWRSVAQTRPEFILPAGYFCFAAQSPVRAKLG